MSTEKLPQNMLFVSEAIETGRVPARHRSRSGEAGGMGVKGRERYPYRDGMYWMLLRF